ISSTESGSSKFADSAWFLTDLWEILHTSFATDDWFVHIYYEIQVIACILRQPSASIFNPRRVYAGIQEYLSLDTFVFRSSRRDFSAAPTNTQSDAAASRSFGHGRQDR